MSADVVVRYEGAMSTIFLAEPVSARAQAVFDEKIDPDNSTWVGNSVAVEHRYIEGLVEALETIEGLTVELQDISQAA